MEQMSGIYTEPIYSRLKKTSNKNNSQLTFILSHSVQSSCIFTEAVEKAQEAQRTGSHWSPQKGAPVGSYRLRKNSTHTEVDYRISDQLYTLACHSGISRLLYIASKQT